MLHLLTTPFTLSVFVRLETIHKYTINHKCIMLNPIKYLENGNVTNKTDKASIGVD